MFYFVYQTRLLHVRYSIYSYHIILLFKIYFRFNKAEKNSWSIQQSHFAYRIVLYININTGDYKENYRNRLARTDRTYNWDFFTRK